MTHSGAFFKTALFFAAGVLAASSAFASVGQVHDLIGKVNAYGVSQEALNEKIRAASQLVDLDVFSLDEPLFKEASQALFWLALQGGSSFESSFESVPPFVIDIDSPRGVRIDPARASEIPAEALKIYNEAYEPWGKLLEKARENLASNRPEIRRKAILTLTLPPSLGVSPSDFKLVLEASMLETNPTIALFALSQLEQHAFSSAEPSSEATKALWDTQILSKMKESFELSGAPELAVQSRRVRGNLLRARFYFLSGDKFLATQISDPLLIENLDVAPDEFVQAVLESLRKEEAVILQRQKGWVARLFRVGKKDLARVQKLIHAYMAPACLAPLSGR